MNPPAKGATETETGAGEATEEAEEEEAEEAGGASDDRSKDAAAKRELENEKNRQAMIKSRLYRALKADDLRRLAEEWGEPTSYNGKNVTAQTLAQNLAAREGFNEKDADDFIE